MPLELEPHHVPRVAGDRGQLDRLHGDGRARETDGRGARPDLPRVELGPKSRRRLLGLDHEAVEPPTRDPGGNEPVTEEEQGEAYPVQQHRVRVS